jgi:hypothetical protein
MSWCVQRDRKGINLPAFSDDDDDDDDDGCAQMAA